MNPAIEARLEQLHLRLEEISALLSEPQVIGDQERFRKLSREYAEIQPLVSHYRELKGANAEIEAARALLAEPDNTLHAPAREELARLGEPQQQLEPQPHQLLPAKDRATGAISFSRCAAPARRRCSPQPFRMYSACRAPRLDRRGAELGPGDTAATRKSSRALPVGVLFAPVESAHRVQRVPETEPRSHLACTGGAARQAIDQIDISPTISTDTFRAGRRARQQDRFGYPHHPSVESDARSTRIARAMSILSAAGRMAQAASRRPPRAEDRRGDRPSAL